MIEIFTSKDYGRFDSITGNRAVNQKKVKDLVKDIQDGLNLLPYCPIVVAENDDRLDVIDGQHRLKAAMQCDQPVYYVICDSLSLNQIARLNSRSDKWKSKDFLECYAKCGIEDYKQLQAFLDKFPVSYSTATSLLMNMTSRDKGGYMEKFRNGEFKCNHLAETTELLELVESLFGRYKFCFSPALIDAVKRIRDKGGCDFEILKQKIKKNTNLMEQQSSIKYYLQNIELIYNHGLQKRVSIY